MALQMMDSETAALSAMPARVRLRRSMLQQAGIEVRHAMPGRLRVRIALLRRRPDLARLLRVRVLALGGVLHVESRGITGSLVLLYEPETVTSRALLERIYDCVRELAILPPSAEAEVDEVLLPEESSCACASCRPASGSGALGRALWLTGAMLYAGLRVWILRLPLVQTPLSLLGLAAVWGTCGLVKDAVRDRREHGAMTVKPLLALGSIVSIAMGQSFSALQILWIYNVAEASEDYVNRHSRQAIGNLLEVAPATAFIMRGGMEVEIAVAAICPGDVVAVHTGERMPVDGVVVDGEALLDESSINGRSEFQEKSRGDFVYAGTMLTQGVLFVETRHTGEDTYLARIVRMVDEALANRAPIEQKADRLASRLMRVGLAATAVTWFLTFDPMRTLTVLLTMSCPCATVLAASSAVTAALANAAKRSILIKGGLYLEQVGKADLFCLDKTGTLTQETPEVVAVHARVPSLDRKRLLAMAATAESHNHHPMAQAILAAARAEGAAIAPHAVCEFMVGRGVLCTLGGDAVILVGNARFLGEHGVEIGWFENKAASERKRGNTVVYVAKNGSALGMIAIANPVRPEALSTLQALRADGVRELSLITGDTEQSAQSLMDLFPFDACRAELLPEEKAQWVSALRKQGVVAMVGDGVNDALALARADIGIAMGAAGAEAAIEAADIALADSNLEGLIMVRNLSHQTMRIIEQNHALALGTDLIGTALAMMGMLHPVLAGLIHILHTGGIVLNSGRLLSWEAPEKAQPQLCRKAVPPGDAVAKDSTGEDRVEALYGRE